MAISKPFVNGSAGTWGTILNAALDNLDVRLAALGNNVLDFGATGDGTTDDTAVVQAAIDAGGPVYFPAGGRYVVSGLTLPSGACLLGGGMGGYVKNYSPVNQPVVPSSQRAVLVLKPAANGHAVTIPVGTSNGLISNLEIDGNKANQSSGSGAGIYLADASQAEESQWKFNRVYVHDTRQHGLYIGVNRMGTQTHQSVYFQCGTSDTTGGSGIVVKGSDATIDTCLVGVAWADSVLVQADVTRLVNSETFSNVLTATTAGNGVTIADGVSRCVLNGNTFDRSAGHGVYMGFDAINNTLIGNVFHSNSQKTNGSAFHLIIKAGGGGTYNNLAIGNQFARNDPGASSNKPTYAIYVDTGAQLYGHGLNVFDAGSYSSAPLNNTALYVAPTP